MNIKKIHILISSFFSNNFRLMREPANGTPRPMYMHRGEGTDVDDSSSSSESEENLITDSDSESDTQSEIEMNSIRPKRNIIKKRKTEIDLTLLSEKELTSLEARIKTRKLDLKNEMEEIFKCGICLETKDLLSPPVVLPCKHIYCGHCVLNLQKKLCPLCRRSFEGKEVLICILGDTVGICKQKYDNFVKL